MENVSASVRTTPGNLTAPPQSAGSAFRHPDYASFEALVFDCDGTLADTMPAHYLAWRDTMNAHGIDFPEDRFYALGGVPAHRIVAMLAQEQGKPLSPREILAAAEEKERAFEAHIHTVCEVGPVVQIAREYHRKLPLAVATGGYRRIVERSLELLHIRHLFSVIVSQEDVEHHKPAPDTYLLAAERLGVRPDRCCAFEDTDLGIRSARDAGMTVVDIRQLCAAAAG